MTNFTVVGAGGTASHLIPALARMCEGDDLIHVWDGDTVEEKNLKRQMFEAHEVGMPKANVWERRFPQRVSPHAEYLDEDRLKTAMQEQDVVFICADNMVIRRYIAERAAEMNYITVINGGNEMFTGSSQLHIRRGGQNISPPITYHSPEINRVDPDMAALSCAEIAELPGGEQTMVANMTVATLMLHAYVQSMFTWLPLANPDKQATKVTFDIQTATWQGSDVRMQGEDWR